MDARVISLRYDGACVSCATAIPAKTRAWWDRSTKQVTCVECCPEQAAGAPILEHAVAGASAETKAQATAPRPLPPPPPIIAGTAGSSAAKQFERRTTREQRDSSASPSTPSRSTAAWAKGADRRRLGTDSTSARTCRTSSGTCCTTARFPKNKRGNIDHLVIAPSGVWIIDGKNYTGKVERRHSRWPLHRRGSAIRQRSEQDQAHRGPRLAA